MRPPDRILAEQISTVLTDFAKDRRPLPGIQTGPEFNTFVEQLIESIRRVKYYSVLREREISDQRANPKSPIFDPLRAAVLHHRNGNVDEAFWLVFLSIHFGKHRFAGWRYVSDIYGKLGDGEIWSWENTSANLNAFRTWLRENQESIKNNGLPHSGFGNHRKYMSLDADSQNGTGAAIQSYINWIGPQKRHIRLIEEASDQLNSNPKSVFDYLYHSMGVVKGFGRTGRFDYLTTVGNLDLATIEPGFVYLRNSTGPLSGARLLFGGKYSIQELEERLIELDLDLKVGMQVIEDALCNWQKSPNVFKKFRG